MPEYPRPAVPAGTSLDKQPPIIFQPFTIRGLRFQNRIWVSPMCQYSAREGLSNDFHFGHLASFILRGPSLTFVEATAVEPAGRISPLDCGLWNDEQISRLARVTAFAHGQGQKIGVQLAHAGRKASTRAPWQLTRGKRSEVALPSEGGWPDAVVGPTMQTWGPGHAEPSALSPDDIARITEQFGAAASRAVRAQVDVLEIHAAHGYLLSSFLSSSSNTRTDEYGGCFSNRCRIALDVVRGVRRVIPSKMPLTFRVSVTEWLPEEAGGWDVSQTVELGVLLKNNGVDVLVISSGGNSAQQKVPSAADYQTALAGRVRRMLRARGCDLIVGLVGRITQPQQALQLLHDGGVDATGDIILAGRQFMKEPEWVLRTAKELGVRVQWPLQYGLGRYGLETKL